VAERTLTARSVVASTLLGTSPPQLPGRLLVRAAGLFGISEGTTRVALSRMVAAGELVATSGTYSLAGHLLDRQARYAASRSGRTTRWSGDWVMAVVVAERRAATDRAELRREFLARHFGELREGVWTRPDNLDSPARPDVAGEHCAWLTTEPENPAELVGLLWDLPSWASTAQSLLDRMAPVASRLDRHDTAALAPGFVLSAEVVRHLQADPLLPAALLPRGWPGAALREAYDRYDAAFKTLMRDWYRDHR